MPALDRLPGLRVVADPAALDAASGAAPPRSRSSASPPTTPSPSVPRRSRSTTSTRSSNPSPASPAPGCRVEAVAHHIEWSLPTERPALAQGAVANVPARVWLPDDGDALLVTAAAYADELASRLR